MHAKLFNVLALAVAWGMASCKTPIPTHATDGSIAPAAGGTSLAAGTGGNNWALTGGSWGGGGSAGESNATTAWPQASGGRSHVSTGGLPSTGGNTATAVTTTTPGTGGDTAPTTGGAQGKGGNGTGGSSSSSAGGASGPATSTLAKSPLDLVPLDNEEPGWLVDKEHSRDPSQRAMMATNYTETVNLIDGAAENFYTAPNIPRLFLWQNYLNPALSPPDGAMVRLFILVMPSAAQAKGLYTAILEKAEYTRSLGTPLDWQPTTPTIGTESRIQDTGAQWWINFYKDVYYVEVLLDPSFGPPPDYVLGDPATKQAALGFAQAIAARI